MFVCLCVCAMNNLARFGCGSTAGQLRVGGGRQFIGGRRPRCSVASRLAGGQDVAEFLSLVISTFTRVAFGKKRNSNHFVSDFLFVLPSLLTLPSSGFSGCSGCSGCSGRFFDSWKLIGGWTFSLWPAEGVGGFL